MTFTLSVFKSDGAGNDNGPEGPIAVWKLASVCNHSMSRVPRMVSCSAAPSVAIVTPPWVSNRTTPPAEMRVPSALAWRSMGPPARVSNRKPPSARMISRFPSCSQTTSSPVETAAA